MSEINLNYNLHVIGNPNYCRSLANMRTFTNFFDITGGVDYFLDCPNDDFRLSSVLFKSRNPEEVIQIGHELVELFNSLNKLLFPTDFRRLPLVIDEILNNDEVLNYSLEKKKDFKLFNSHYISNKVDIESDLSELIKNNNIFGLLLLSFVREDIYVLLKLISNLNDKEEDWTQLYKIFESLKNFSKITNIDTNFDKKILEELKKSSNNFSISGINSRHGFVNSNNVQSVIDYTEAKNHILYCSKLYLFKSMDLVKTQDKIESIILIK